MKHFILYICILLCAVQTPAQSLKRSVSVTIDKDTVRLDSLPLVPGSTQITFTGGQTVNDSLYRFDHAKGLLVVSPALRNHTINVSYRVFIATFNKPYFHKDINEVQFAQNRKSVYRQPQTMPASFSEMLGGSGLVSEGSISRGISFGTNNDLSVSSGLNLTLHGKLGNNMNVLASISDNNIPVQADGTTQQIQDFEKVFIQVYNDKTSITAGDIEMAGGSYFMQFHRKAKGGMFSYNTALAGKTLTGINTSTGVAVAKGKYNRMALTAIEGSQGPYRLTGAQSEQYIIILSGTERVYIDGTLLKRGFDNDYVIDYNSAEITFTSRMPITKDKRIIVEFEYSDQNYTRYMLFHNTRVSTEKGNIAIGYFSETDGKNSTDNDLVTKNRKYLSAIGDSIQDAIVPYADSIAFTSDIILYKKVDTIIGIDTVSYYQYSTNPDSAFYRLGFSYTGPGSGDYDQVVSLANGKVYAWVGENNGSYIPAVLLVTPKKQQMLTLNGETMIAGAKATFELAGSNYDKNTFSSVNNDDNTGYALKCGIDKVFRLRDTTNTIIVNASYRHVQKNFTAFERYHSVEYERDWNIFANETTPYEHYMQFNSELMLHDLLKSGYNFEYLLRESSYKGMRNSGRLEFKHKGYELQAMGSIMQSDNALQNSEFTRYKITGSKTIRFIKAGATNEFEQNMMKYSGFDSLMGSSFKFNQWTAFIENPDSAKDQYFARYIIRTDFLPYTNVLDESSRGKDIQVGYTLNRIRNNSISAVITHRRLDYVHDTVSHDDETVTAGLRYFFKTNKEVFSAGASFETAAGSEPANDFSYVEVLKGNGTYAWIDYNNNGIKERDEFEVAKFKDNADYVRVMLPTTIYRKTNANMLNVTFSIMPYKAWKKQTGMKKFISRFSEQCAFKTDNKTLRIDNINFNPFYADAQNDDLVSVSTSLRNTVSFNKFNPRYTIDYTFMRATNKILLTDGFDTRNNTSHSIESKVKVSKWIYLYNTATQGLKTYASEYMSNRNYSISYMEDKISSTFESAKNNRFGLAYNIRYKRNDAQSTPDEETFIHIVTAESTFNSKRKTTFTCKTDYIYITFNSDVNSMLAYEMLEGLKPGNNGVCEMHLIRSFESGMEIGINYSGRVSEGEKIIHTGGMQARLNF